MKNRMLRKSFFGGIRAHLMGKYKEHSPVLLPTVVDLAAISFDVPWTLFNMPWETFVPLASITKGA